MIRILSSARGKALLGLVLLLCLLAGALLFWQTDGGDSAHYTLVGDGWRPIVLRPGTSRES